MGAATAALGGGNGLQGALGAAASERASGAMQDYLVQHGILPTDPLFKTLMQLGSAAIGGVVGSGSGTATALQGEQFNRQLHETEKARIKALAGGDPQKEADLSAAACALVHCSAEYAKDSPEYAYYSRLEALGGQPQYADERTLLQQQSITRDVVIPSGMSVPVTENLFDYSYGDKTSDTLTYINNSYGHPFTRVGGVLQAIGGGGAMVTGGAAVATGAAGCPETLGGGCALAAGGMLLTGWGLDQAQAGGRTVWNGTSTQTFGGQAIQQAFGISPQAAELMYGALGAAGTLATSNTLLAARGAPLLSGGTATGGVLPSLDTEVLTVGQARNLVGANKGLIYVQETPVGGQAAQDFQAGTSGAFSDAASQKSAVPALRYDNPNTNGYNYVKFDGIEQGADGSQVLLIDAKTKLAIWSDSTRQSVSDTLLRVDAALKQNPGYQVVYEFPNERVAQQARQFIRDSPYANTVTVRVRGQ